jgi:hypothetical protein
MRSAPATWRPHSTRWPRRLPNTRRALTPDELEEINLVARTSGNDVTLDAILLRLHTETACRRGGAIGLRLASGVGLSVMAADGLRGITAASDPASERIEELQFLLGEGPCIDAFATRRPVLVLSLADGATHRWPVYAPAAYADGVRPVFAFPLQVGAALLGVLDVFRARPGSLSGEELRQGDRHRSGQHGSTRHLVMP